jgi:hypothetical protein
MMSRGHADLREEHGGILVIVAAALGALVLIVAFVVDVANWKVHKRHLQLQADAAALAAAHSISLANCSDPLIKAEAHKYAGPDSSGQLALYNEQVGGTPATNMHILINSLGYYGDSGAGDDTDPNGSPCTSKYVDIKATEVDLPWYFGGLVPKINAHARVSMVQLSTSNGSLPIAVPNPLPTAAGVVFINEANGNVLATAPLVDAGVSGPLQMYASSAATPASVQIATHTGVVIVLSGRPGGSLSLSGTLASICSQPLTECYDAETDPPTRGLSYIRGYNPGGNGAQPNRPLLHSVELFAGACSGSPYFSDNTAACVYDIWARIDKGDLANAAVIIKANGVQLFSDSGAQCDAMAGTEGCWHAQMTLPAGSGRNDITMTWEETSGQVQIGNKLEDCKSGGGNKCTGDFENGVTVQRAYSARDADTGSRSGPIKVVKVWRCDGDVTCSLADRQSYAVDSTHTFAVSIGIAGTLRNATSVNEPLVQLRVKTQSGQSLDCDPVFTNLKSELAGGCGPTYEPNTGSPDCSVLGTNAARAFPQPWTCVAVSTGSQPNDVTAGLNQRIHGNEKPNACEADGAVGHNNWWMFDPADPDQDGTYGFPPGDTRVLNAFLTTYGAFSHVNGTSGSVPVIGFGHFYVTGYTGQGQGFTNPCRLGPVLFDQHPDDPVPNDDPGLIVGHFIFYVDKLGGDGTQPCNPNVFGSCVIIMTK